MLVLGLQHMEPHEIDSRWLKVAEGVAETCYKMYKLAWSGLSPEYVRFNVADEQTGTSISLSLSRGVFYCFSRDDLENFWISFISILHSFIVRTIPFSKS